MLRGTSIRARGFTLIEVIVAMAIFAILVAMAVPAMNRWVSNVKVRSTADALQNGLRMAQTESLRRSRQVVFSLTNSPNPQSSLTAVDNGKYWSINTIPSVTGESGVFVESGPLTSSTSGVTITGPAEICFNSMGRLVKNATTGVSGPSCDLPTNSPPVSSYLIKLATADRNLRVDVTLGGQVHLCDPLKSLSTDNPDGCAS